MRGLLQKLLYELSFDALRAVPSSAEFVRIDYEFDVDGYITLRLVLAAPQVVEFSRRIPHADTRRCQAIRRAVNADELGRMAFEEWSAAVEDARMMQAYQDLASLGHDASALREHVSRYHLNAFYVPPDLPRAETATQVAARSQIAGYLYNGRASRDNAREDRDNAIEAFRSYADYRRQMLQDWDFQREERDEINKRGRVLLVSHLSPSQRTMYEQNGYFEVVGCHTGRTYRIHEGRQMNIHELDKNGNPVCGFCFLPAGNLCNGDTMLGQKIALELEEKAALKVANKFPIAGNTHNGALHAGLLDVYSRIY